MRKIILRGELFMERVNVMMEDPQAMETMMGFDKYLEKVSVPRITIDLILIRASQLNGCGFCIDMHTKEARKNGETDQRMLGLSGWKHSTFYTDEERAALQITEELTTLPHQKVSDDAYKELTNYFNHNQIGEIIMAIVAINSWNRFVIAQGIKAPSNI
ncbi:hypothetical protein BU120_09370 [Staphylococcus xylosus]|jgi:AhpD family alkylhydroperoxidase|nr:hypothetical protein BU120_09370 [Staphylococcus xylosus]